MYLIPDLLPAYVTMSYCFRATPEGRCSTAHCSHQARLDASATVLNIFAEGRSIVLAILIQVRVRTEIHRGINLQLEYLLGASRSQHILRHPASDQGSGLGCLKTKNCDPLQHIMSRCRQTIKGPRRQNDALGTLTCRLVASITGMQALLLQSTTHRTDTFQ